MVTITIRDLPDSVDLDRQAMLAITGGARFSGRPDFALRSASRSGRIIDYPGSFGVHALAESAANFKQL